ncbi:hypothetical protein L4C33_19775 [Vibrio makurazakiensis]|uniref:hypothetical protein n=1 Tax=Vibrio makurazakiensis TaxID=2910250 RepID=UPI003D0C0EDF
MLSDIEYSLGDTQGSIDTLGSDLTDQLSELSTKIDGIASGGVPSNGTDLSGLESAVTGIQNLLGSPNQFVQPTPGVSGAFKTNFLFGDDAFKELEASIVDLKDEYQAEAAPARDLLGINTEGFQSGDFSTHNLTLKNFNGENVEYENKVFSALLDNADIIKSVLLFIVVLIGIRMLGSD